MKTHIAINGACGRMGQRLIALTKDDPELAVVAAVDSAKHPLAGKDAGEVVGIGHIGVPITGELPLEIRPHCVIDFSAPQGTMAILPTCIGRKIPLVVATTGHTDAQKVAIEEAAHDTAVLFAPNMSLVVNVLFKLVGLTAEALKGKGFDAEIVERHHRFKKDSPSGTAVHFAEIIRQVQGGRFVHGREGLVGERTADEIGIHAVRGGDNVGEHTIIFTTLGETLELVHKGHSRDSYARGALLAAKFLATKTAGRYTMADVLGL
ncbi:MAG TPA: 4-hydroxy-tetrahydrodipicolinate reductase [Gemmataceae bacterium]|nr:4-hydroxy-tetrahydrodipicolinate reductase [Gemmataceae bacterium]